MSLILDTATVYQIFYRWYQGHTQTQIAIDTGCMRDTVAAHLSLRHWHKYPPALQERLKKILTPKRPGDLPVPQGWITLDDASYFFLRRFSAKTLRECHKALRTERIACQRLTRREWVLDYVAQRYNTDSAEGIYITKNAAALCKIPTTQQITRLAELATLPPFDARTISRALRILDYTGLPYLTLDAADIVERQP